MIQRLIAVTIGGIATFVVLWLSTIFAGEADQLGWFAAAAVIGAVASFFWPVIIGIWLGRRSRARRNDRIEAEVQRQVAEKQKQG